MTPAATADAPVGAAAPAGPGRRQRRLARLALTAAGLAVVVLLAAAGARGLALALVVAAHYAVIVTGLWLFLAHRGVLRVAGLVVVIGTAVSVPVVEAMNGLLWVSVACTGLLIVALVAAEDALATPRRETPPEPRVPPPHHAFVLMNPRSGGGKVERYGLRSAAERLGAQVVVLDDHGEVDVAELARKAIADGADLLGVAAGDGTQALVAGVAADHDVPLMVIPAGTRNHFALDLGLDRDDPARALDGLIDGVELRVDLGDVDGRPFVNNASFGAYATIVARPDYRDDKARVTLDVLPDLLTGHQGPRLTVRADGVEVAAPNAALVSNNPYGTGDIAGLGRRARLDGGLLGLVTIRVANAAQAAELLRGRQAPGITVATAARVVVEASETRIPAGIDGESVLLTTPVTCAVRPGALRVRLPRERPGVPAVREPLTLTRLVSLALPTHRDSRRAS